MKNGRNTSVRRGAACISAVLLARRRREAAACGAFQIEVGRNQSSLLTSCPPVKFFFLDRSVTRFAGFAGFAFLVSIAA
jgi:hypothetical protein